MAQLSFNPDGHHIRDGRTLAEIIADEEYLDPEEPVKEKAEKEEKKVKFMSFELDMTYPRTLRGFVRILQVLLLVVAFVCLIITSWDESQGVYSFYCVVLVLGALMSGFLFFMIISGSRQGTCCGLTWVKLELLYFVLFGFVIFIGACVAASNNTTSNPAINAGVAFGFIACITFGIYIFWTWKDYKNPPDDEDEKKNDEEEGEDKDPEMQKDNDSLIGGPGVNNSVPRHTNGSMIDPPEHQNGDIRIDAPQMYNKNQSGNFRGPPGMRPNDGTRSLERPLSIISTNEIIDPKHKKEQHHRRRRSGSDNDSAYSEGSMVEKDRSLPTKIRRTASARGGDGLRHSMRKPRDSGERRAMNGSGKRRMQELSAAELLNQDDGRQRKPVPSWLRAALDDDEHDRPGPGRRLVSTMPSQGRKNEFPLLHMSDEESIAYPSVSQTLGHNGHWNRQVLGANDRGGHRHHAHRGRRGGAIHAKNQRVHGPHHGVHHRGGKRFHTHGHRHMHMNGKRPVHGHHRGHGRHAARQGRMGHRGHHKMHHPVPNERVRPEDDIFLRRMVENDQLVQRNDRIGTGNANNGQNNRRMIPEQPTSIQFPEQSRWDDNEPALPEYGGPNTMIEKYLNS